MFIKYTGTLDSACTITISPNTMKRVHIIENGTSGSQNIIISQGSGTNVTIAPGTAKVLYLDGGGSGANVVDAFAHLAAVDLTVDDDLIVSDDVTLKSDGAVLGFGADTDTTLTHTDGTGLTLNSTNKLTFGDVASFVQQSSDGVLRIDGEATIDMNASTAVTISNDLKLDSDSAVLGFGADNDVTLTHVADSALLLNDAIKMTFRDSALSVSSSTDGQLDVDADTEVEITAPTIDLTASTAVTISNDVSVAGRGTGTQTTDNDGDFDLSVSNFFKCTPSGNITLTFSNPAEGQSGTVMLVNTGGHTISAHASVAINADILTALTTAGTYMLNYYCSASSGNNTILVGATGALT